MNGVSRSSFQSVKWLNRIPKAASTNQSSQKKYVTRQFEEIEIKVPWGHIAGKWYGSRHERPLVGLHGWQDNAGTFDTLAAYLPEHISFVSLDLPGHGYSSHLPEGMHYNSIDYIRLLSLIMDECKWNKISLMAHSMSSINSFVFAALFPDKVDLVIGLDALKPLTRPAQEIIDAYTKRLKDSLKWDHYKRYNSEPPTYEWQQLIERLHTNTKGSIHRDACKFLLERNVKSSANNPAKYYFSRDNRLKSTFFYTFSQEVPLEMAKRIICPYLFIKATKSPYYEEKHYYYEVLTLMQTKEHFEYYEIDGSHHVHLNEPEKVADIICDFLNKWKP